jgi:hypothetical protein
MCNWSPGRRKKESEAIFEKIMFKNLQTLVRNKNVPSSHRRKISVILKHKVSLSSSE